MRGIDGFRRSMSLFHIHMSSMLVQPAIEMEDITTAHYQGARFYNEAALL